MWQWIKNVCLSLIGKSEVSVITGYETLAVSIQRRLTHTESRCDLLEIRLDETKKSLGETTVHLATAMADVEDCKKDREAIRDMEAECRREAQSLRDEIHGLRRSMKSCPACECPINGKDVRSADGA